MAGVAVVVAVLAALKRSENLTVLTPSQFFEWSGCAFGLAGAWLLATNCAVSRWGWLAFLLANFAMIAFAVEIDAYGLLLQQLGFTGSSLLGLYRTGLWPRLGAVN